MITSSLRGLRVLSVLTFVLITGPTLHAAARDALAPTQPLSGDAYDRLTASARGVAGLSASDASWQSSPEWTSYRDWLDGRWRYMNRIRLGAMRNWGGSELGGVRGNDTVFYPFSGPDFLYADTLFPSSRVMLMAGLEPIGSMPDLARLQQQGALGSYLQQIKTSLFTILAASFFKTKDMKSDFSSGGVDGLLPAMVVFLERQGYGIDSIDYVSLSGDGTLHPRSSKSGANGVQITYFRGDRDSKRVLCYFQVNLANDGSSGYENLMRRTGPGVTYLKAASYLLYEDYFSKIRNAILENSDAVVEDDSGIPYRYFKAAGWDVTPYGNYTGPIALFKEHYQPDLADFYHSEGHSSLPFGSGYKYVASGSSLLVARKK